MSTKKGYKSVPWLFGKAIEIPEEWEVKRLGQLTKFSSGEFLPQSKQVNGKIPVYGGNGITGWHNQPLINNSTVVFGRVGVYCGIVYLSENKSWITDNAIFVKELSNDLDLKYFFLYLSRLNINLLAEVSAQPKITQGILNHIGIKFPIDKKEQQKIASILSNVDNLIDSTNKIIENSKSLKTGLMQKFYNLIENRKYPLSEVLDLIIDHRGLTPKKLGSDWVKNGIPVISAYNIKNFKLVRMNNLRFIKTEVAKKWMPKHLEFNDVLITSEGATLGQVALFDKTEHFVIGQRLFAVRSKKNVLDNQFLYYFLIFRDGQKQIFAHATGTTTGGLRQTELIKIEVPLPSFEKQQKIASILSNIDAKIDSQTQYKDKLEKLKKSLMQKLLTGEVRV